MKKNKFFAIVAILAITISGVLVFQACKKGEPINNVTDKNPIAVKNIKTGEIKYNVELSKIQSKVDEFTRSRGGDEILVESWSITEDGPDDSPVLRFSLIDTDSESSEKVGLLHCIDVECDDNGTEYYLSDYVSTGNYEYITSDGVTDYLATVENFEVVSLEIVGKRERQQVIEITCKTSHHCKNSLGCWPTTTGCTICSTGLAAPNDTYPCEQTVKGTLSSVCVGALN